MSLLTRRTTSLTLPMSFAGRAKGFKEGTVWFQYKDEIKNLGRVCTSSLESVFSACGISFFIVEIGSPIAAPVKFDRRLDPRHVPKTQNIVHKAQHIVDIFKDILGRIAR